MLPSQTILSQLQIPLPQVPSGADPQKTTNDFTGAILAAYQSIDVIYKSPDNLPLPTSIGIVLTPDQIAMGLTEAQAIATLAGDPWSQFTPEVVAAQSAAVANYRAITTSGKLPAIHTALDNINALAPLTKQPIIDAYPDLAYLRCAAGIIGQVAQLCGPDGGIYFLYGKDPVTDNIIAAAIAGTGPASMQPTVFF